MSYEAKMPTITNELRSAASYLDSEKIVVNNVKQQLKDGFPIPTVEENLKKLYAHLTLQLEEKKGNEAVNYKYAAAYLKTLITTPYWHSWIETV